MKRLDVFTLDNLWHFLAGAGIVGVCWGLGAWAGFPVVGAAMGHITATVSGLYREFDQHWDDIPIWTPHRVVEGVMWSVGGLPVHVTAWLV